LAVWSTCTLPKIFEYLGDQRKIIGVMADLHVAMSRCIFVIREWAGKALPIEMREARETEMIRKGLVGRDGEEEGMSCRKCKFSCSSGVYIGTESRCRCCWHDLPSSICCEIWSHW